jgi:UDPglucose 6-dehydrogenase
MMQLHGASVTVYDPKAIENSRTVFPTLNYATSTSEACKRADAVLVATEWSEFVELQPSQLDSVVHGRVIIDGRNCLDPSLWRSAGWIYRGVGR